MVSLILTKSRAALFVMTTLSWPWKAVGLLAVLPTSVADRLYELIARNRYRVFGRQEQCLHAASDAAKVP